MDKTCYCYGSLVSHSTEASTHAEREDTFSGSLKVFLALLLTLLLAATPLLSGCNAGGGTGGNAQEGGVANSGNGDAASGGNESQEKVSERLKSQPSYESERVSGLYIPASLKDKQYGSVTFIVGNTANQPIPRISADTAGYLAAAWLTGKTKTLVISAAGSVEHTIMALPELAEINRDGNENRNLQAQAKNVTALQEAINTDPGKDHLDFFGAIKEAIAQTRGDSGNKLLIIIGSGLSDAGYLNFAGHPELLNSDASEVAQNVTGSGSGVSSSSLAEVDVVLSGFGHSVVPQTERLEPDGAENSIANLEAIYQATIEAMGGHVFIDKTSGHLTQSSVQTENTVSATHLIIVSPPPDGLPKEGAELGEGMVRFIPDTAEFADKNAAIEALKPYSDTLKQSGQSVQILGYQALPPGASVSDLPERRAQAVRDLLVELGVDAAQIVECRGDGAGQDRPGGANEYDESGKWDTNLAQANRIVLLKPV